MKLEELDELGQANLFVHAMAEHHLESTLLDQLIKKMGLYCPQEIFETNRHLC